MRQLKEKQKTHQLAFTLRDALIHLSWYFALAQMVVDLRQR